jgi:hypothetical protein
MSSLLMRIRRVIFGPPPVSSTFEGDIRRQIDLMVSSHAQKGVLNDAEERTRTLEHMLQAADERADRAMLLIQLIEQRSRTLEFVAHQTSLSQNYQVEFLQRMYVEFAPRLAGLRQNSLLGAETGIVLKTEFPLAYDSQDHLNPDSTAEGVARPTLFVQDCMRVLGNQLKTLDLGTGAAGIPFEFAMNGNVALGVDGSDFCKKNRIGFWPLLPDNLFTCDITKPFVFSDSADHHQIKFDVITMWEVLEHLQQVDLDGLFKNIASHLGSKGYFIGSVSLIEYSDNNGHPYHVTLQPREWWKTKMAASGLEMLDQHPLIESFFPRGNGPRYQDFHNYAKYPEEGFLFVARSAL